MPKRVLVVEDDAGYQELFQLSLRAHCEVTLFDTVEKSLEDLTNSKDKKYDLIISDINLLGLTGMHFLTEIKEGGLTRHIPVIICSSMDDPSTRKQCMESGAAAFLPKPFDPQILVKMVGSLLAL